MLLAKKVERSFVFSFIFFVQSFVLNVPFPAGKNSKCDNELNCMY